MSAYRRPRPKTEKQLAFECDRWNEAMPVGSFVDYYPVKGLPEHLSTRTTSAAYVLSGHTAVVFVEGKAGCVALDHCAPVKAEGRNA